MDSTTQTAIPKTDERSKYPCIMNSCTINELDTIQGALLRILQDENPLPACGNTQRKAALSSRLNNNELGRTREVLDNDRHLVQQSLGSTDLKLLAKLLNQVRILKTHNAHKGSLVTGVSNAENQAICSFGFSKRVIAEAVTATSEAAKAATLAAEKLEIVKAKMIDASEADDGNCGVKCTCEASETEDKEDQGVGVLDNQEKIVKTIERQNKIAHWILGLLIITTAFWHFKGISFLLHLQKTFSNPFQSIGDFFSDRFKGPKEGPTNASLDKAGMVLPSLLHGEHHKTIQGSLEQTSSGNSKENEGLTLSLDNLLTIGKSDSH